MKSLDISNWDMMEPVIPFASLKEEPANFGAVGQLAAGIAHHFNNLLTPIHANSQLLLELNNFAPDSRNLVEQTLAASRRAAQLIRQLAGLSECQPLNIRPLDLNRAVENIMDEFPPAAHGGIECDFHYGLDLPRVLADGASLHQVISHLLLNACDAMPHGGRLTLSTERLFMPPTAASARPGQFVCLNVSDTGCGIPLQNMAHLGEPFFTTKQTSNRSGLGLAFVYGIVKQHRGWTEVSSKMGQGTTFKICLPAAAALPDLVLEEWSEPSRHATRLLPASEATARWTFNDDPPAVRATFDPARPAPEPFHHWGINE